MDAQFSSGMMPKSCSSPCNLVAQTNTQPWCFGLFSVSSVVKTIEFAVEGLELLEGLQHSLLSFAPARRSSQHLTGSSCSFCFFFFHPFSFFHPIFSLHVPPCVLNHKNVFFSLTLPFKTKQTEKKRTTNEIGLTAIFLYVALCLPAAPSS